MQGLLLFYPPKAWQFWALCWVQSMQDTSELD